MIEGFHLGAGGPVGQVCLMHGFTGSPWDLIPVGEILAGQGFEVHCPRLPGHGFPDQQEENAWPAWLARGQSCLDEAVAEAYGWGDDWRDGKLTDDEILARLFRLNQERAAKQDKT